MPGRADDAFKSLTAISAILDLANGLEHDKSLLTALFAFELAADAGLPPDAQRAAFLAGVLRHLGCTSYAAQETALAPDDIAFRSRLIHGDSKNPRHVLRAVTGERRGLADQLLGVVKLAANASRMRSEWTREACGGARALALGLQLGPDVVRALDEVFERWDGTGGPNGLGGTALSHVGRVCNTAHVAIVFWLQGGVAEAQELLSVRSAKVLDPTLAKRARTLINAFAETKLEARLERVERTLQSHALPFDAKTLAVTFGEFADLQLPFSRGHSRRVAELAQTIATTLNFSAEEQAHLSLAAHLHDLGQVAVPTGLWLERAWSDETRQRARLHSLFTERVLSSSEALKPAALIAGAHHERLDGSGSHRGLASAALPRTARALAVAEMACGLVEQRPHRTPLAEAAALDVLRSEVKAGRLDAECVAAATGQRHRSDAPRGPLSQLTPREVEVLRLLAQGQTNKQIAATLGISDRTVQHHSINVYGKLGVDTRAAATLLAARHGLV